jgi:hypothetical protein
VARAENLEEDFLLEALERPALLDGLPESSHAGKVAGAGPLRHLLSQVS